MPLRADSTRESPETALLTKVNCHNTIFHTAIKYIVRNIWIKGKAVPLPAPCRFAKPAASFLSMALLSCQLSHAATAYIPPNDFQPNCDIRRLGLTQSQHNELRKIRTAFKMAGDRARLKVMHSEHSRRRSVPRMFLIGTRRAIMSKAAICPVWILRWTNWKSNTGSSISSHRNSSKCGFLPASNNPRNAHNARCFGSLPAQSQANCHAERPERLPRVCAHCNAAICAVSSYGTPKSSSQFCTAAR